MTKRPQLSVDEYVAGVLADDRTVLARAITLIESNRPEHALIAQEVLGRLLARSGRAMRLGITGVPGVGKSTFIEALGMQLIGSGLKVAVLAVDPSSSVRGGSILGDKTRMTELSREANAFIRPSPTKGALGGVHRKTRETMILCEAAGFDVILVETVGVGQSEIRVASMVDTFLVLMLAGAGDELQGIKKGILEIADIIAINKADGDNQLPAERARSLYKNAVHLFNEDEDWKPPVLLCSALEKRGVSEVWETVERHQTIRQASGDFEKKRANQRMEWMRSLLTQELMNQFHQDSRVSALLPKLEAKVKSGELNPTAAVKELLAVFRQKN